MAANPEPSPMSGADDDSSDEGLIANMPPQNANGKGKTATAESPKPAASPTPGRKDKTHFEFGDAIGEGSFGQVVKCVEKETGRVVAIKILSKSHVQRENKVKYAKTERDLLDKCRHKSIIRLFYTFTDAANLYYVLELAQGGEILQWLRIMGKFTVEVTRFYIAELVVALEFLASMNVVHRDLKPENILLSEDFHVKITDFGTAKQLGGEDTDEFGKQRSKSFLGTAEYVSPELLVDKFTCLSSDLWSLGCIIFQFLTGRLPFHAPTDYLIFQRIQNRDLTYPDDLPPEAVDLMDQLLILNPDERIGAREGGFAELKAHPFFAGVDFDTIYEGEAPNLSEMAEAHKAEVLASGVDETVKEHTVGVLDRPEVSDRAAALELQRQSKWFDFVEADELIIKDGIVDKRKGLSTKRRALVLTDKPRLFYLDPKKCEYKGEIAWCFNMYAADGNGAKFFVHTPKRKYVLIANDGVEGSAEWVEAINTIQADFRAKVDAMSPAQRQAIKDAEPASSGTM